MSLQSLSDLDFGLSSSLKVSLYSAIGLPMYDFLMLNSNILLKLAPLQDTSLQNLSDLDFLHVQGGSMSDVMVKLRLHKILYF